MPLYHPRNKRNRKEKKSQVWFIPEMKVYGVGLEMHKLVEQSWI